MLAAILNFSAFKWVALPCPADAKFIAPGLARAATNRACNVLMFFDGAITSTLGVVVMGEIPAKSAATSNGSLAKVEGLTVCDDEWIIKV